MRARILGAELLAREAPIGPIGLTNLVWPAVVASADPGLHDELKPGAAKGTVRISLGYTEPDGGSDIANAKTRAERDGDEWVINGQKIFTTNAQFATHIFLITRTDPTLPKHKGMTMFLVPTSSPGFERQPIPTIGEETTNISYYSDIRLPDRFRIGEVNNGWSTLHGPLDAEHHLGGPASKLEDVSGGIRHMANLHKGVDAALDWAKDAPDGDGPMIEDKAFLAGIGHLLTEMEAGAVTPAAMGRVKGSDVARLGCEELITWSARRPPCRVAPTGPSVTARSSTPTAKRSTRPRRWHHRGVPHHHRPARPGTPAAGLPRAQGVPDGGALQLIGGLTPCLRAGPAAPAEPGPARPRQAAAVAVSSKECHTWTSLPWSSPRLSRRSPRRSRPSWMRT